MLNGIDPIIIFNFSKLQPDLQAALSEIPILAKVANKIVLPPIPVYLSEKLTGLMIDSEDKSLEIENGYETLADGKDPIFFQRGIDNSIRINIKAIDNSIGLSLVSAFADQIFTKVTSKEYSITYIHKTTTIFDGLLKSFNITQIDNTNMVMIAIELIKTKPTITQSSSTPVVGTSTGPIPTLN